MPRGLIVAVFFVRASVPSAELCLEDTVANTKGKRKKGRPKEGRIATSPLHSQGSPTPSAGSKIKKGLRVSLERGGRIRGGPQVGKVAT